MATLTLKFTDNTEKALEIGPKPIVIGRVSECDVMVRDAFVSRIHAEIGFTDNQFTLKDLGSTNGTYRNGARIFQCVLNSGDKIQVGNTTLVFELTAESNAILRVLPAAAGASAGPGVSAVRPPDPKQLTSPVPGIPPSAPPRFAPKLPGSKPKPPS
ncbi:MAG: FHA domain-containing protein [Verrucomicrobiae bacterium]|nr:FHA domain-containing protein [Verrucomicrobiae bacterium]MDW8344430.1 FHA domain-containing protein [Verrucomicrobiae bacterium]